ncbi:MAG: hypothetical protein LCH38_00170 [Proteobacteria bacterium]|nr:hypothetical protein [Pseudomonadota bacterium]
MPFFSLNGWRLFLVSGLIILAATFGPLWQDAFSSQSLRWAIRFTARSSAILFLLAFTASALFRLMPNRFTRWQRANRRFLGLSFAFSHFVHASFIIAFAAQGPEQYAYAVTPDMVVVGSIGYALIILMAATSFKATAALIGAKAWAWLHSIGVHWLWLQFVVAFGVRAKAGGPLYWSFIAVFMLALAARLVAWRLRVVAERRMA